MLGHATCDHAYGHAGQLDRGSERWTVTRSAGDWTSSSAPTPGVGKAHHATAVSLLGMARYRDFVRGSLLRNWTSSSAPTHGAGESSHATAIPLMGMVATEISSEDPSSSVDVAYTGRTHGRALVRARGTCANGTVAGALARARGTCAHGINRRAQREAAPARSTGGERERSRAVERGRAAER